MVREIVQGGGRPDAYKLSSGIVVASVSEVLDAYKDKTGLVRWAHKLGLEGKDPETEKEQAAGAGSLCHDQIDCFIHGRAWKEPRQPENIDAMTWDMRLEMAAQGLMAFKDWIASAGVEILGTERGMVSELYRFGGTPDAWGLRNGKKIVLDWKTSNAIFAEYVMQCAAYKQLLIENLDWSAEEVHIVRLGKVSADFEHRRFPGVVVEAAWGSFLGRVRCYEADQVLEGLCSFR